MKSKLFLTRKSRKSVRVKSSLSKSKSSSSKSSSSKSKSRSSKSQSSSSKSQSRSSQSNSSKSKSSPRKRLSPLNKKGLDKSIKLLKSILQKNTVDLTTIRKSADKLTALPSTTPHVETVVADLEQAASALTQKTAEVAAADAAVKQALNSGDQLDQTQKTLQKKVEEAEMAVQDVKSKETALDKVATEQPPQAEGYFKKIKKGVKHLYQNHSKKIAAAVLLTGAAVLAYKNQDALGQMWNGADVPAPPVLPLNVPIEMVQHNPVVENFVPFAKKVDPVPFVQNIVPAAEKAVAEVAENVVGADAVDLKKNGISMHNATRAVTGAVSKTVVNTGVAIKDFGHAIGQGASRTFNRLFRRKGGTCKRKKILS